MFKDHQPIIESYARTSPDNLARVMIFTLLTIQCPLYRAVNDMEIVDEQDEDRMRSILFNFKAPGYLQIAKEKKEIYRDLEKIARETWSDKSLMGTRMVDRISRVTGFAAAKAGFVAQMAYGVSGCLDSHNLRRFGIEKIRVGRKNIAWGTMTHMDTGNRYDKAYGYQRLVDKLGGTETLWNSWCEYVATKFPKWYPSADAVSALHIAPFAGLEVPLAEAA